MGKYFKIPLGETYDLSFTINRTPEELRTAVAGTDTETCPTELSRL